jgi:hypothetical protein
VLGNGETALSFAEKIAGLVPAARQWNLSVHTNPSAGVEKGLPIDLHRFGAVLLDVGDRRRALPG